MKKIVFIAQDINYYKPVFKRLSNRGFKVFGINLNWNFNMVTDWLNYSKNEINKLNIDNNTIIIGHSIGAFIALIVSQKIKFRKVLLFSPSPLFKESLVFLNKTAKRQLGKRRIEDINKNFNIGRLKQNYSNQTCIYIGSKENVIIGNNASLIQKKLRASKLVILEDKNHLTVLDNIKVEL